MNKMRHYIVVLLALSLLMSVCTTTNQVQATGKIRLNRTTISLKMDGKTTLNLKILHFNF